MYRDSCDREACAAETMERSDELLCAPDSEEVGECLCRGGACTHPCDNVVCTGERICDPRRGLCVVNDCRGLGCDEGSLCDVVDRECVEDACADADCEDNEVCRRGACERSCGDVRCGEGERCAGGRCVEDACAGKTCGDGLFCDPESQSCEDDPCERMGCDPGLVCISTSGECERDPCFGVRCPSGQTCRLGECTRNNQGEGPGPQGNPSRFLAAGGGCACSTVGTAPNGDSRFGLAGLVALLFASVAVLRLRRRTRSAPRSTVLQALLTVALAMTSALSSGCEVSPFCVNCVNPSANESGNGGTNGGFGGRPATAATRQQRQHWRRWARRQRVTRRRSRPGWRPDACTPLFEEFNNMEMTETYVSMRTSSRWQQLDQRGICEGSAPSCVGGEFECQYPAEREDEETLCDELDNDCNGRVDEGFDTLGDDCSLGIGQCATPGKLECNGAGTGVLCVVGEPIEPSDEVCDGLDNDCDGIADEPASEPGTSELRADELVQTRRACGCTSTKRAPDATDTPRHHRRSCLLKGRRDAVDKRAYDEPSTLARPRA